MELLLSGILTLCFSVIISAQDGVIDPNQYIADSDTIWFSTPSDFIYDMPGSVFKAINPKFIANMNGFTRSEHINFNYSGEKRTFEKIVMKTFSLVEFNHTRPNYDSNLLTSLNAQKKWNYYINDIIMSSEARALVSALMPQAIERIEFSETDTMLLALDPNVPTGKSFSYQSKGAVRFYTRAITDSTINDSKTAYILNEGQVITRKLYEAIDPVFIRSLFRITNQAEIKKMGFHKGINEVVKINLFKQEEVVDAVGANDCPECNVYLVDNIQIDFKTYWVLNRFYFKDISVVVEDEEEAFAPYRKRFPKKKHKWGIRKVTIITL